METPTLCVTATAPDDDVILTYQWYSGKNRSVLSPITNATSNSYTIPAKDTSSAGTKYYRCDVISNIQTSSGTIPFAVKSDVVTVETRLSYVSKPTILKELGSFVTTKDENFADIYRTNYTSGEKFDLIYISVEEPEDGVKLSYEYYVNTNPDLKSATKLDVTSGQG